MRIALVADVFPPLRSSGAVQLHDLAREFVRQGYQVTAMVAASELASAWAIDNMDGVEVLRLRTPRTRDRGYVARTLGELITPFAMLKGLRRSPLYSTRFSAVIWYSPTIFLGPLVKALKRRSKCASYLIIRDIFPEWGWEMGLIRSRCLYRAFKAVANYQYAQADVIGIQTPGNAAYFSEWRQEHPRVRIEVLHNWLSDKPDVGCSIRVDQSKLIGRKVLVYAGNMGIAQNTAVFCRLAERFQDRHDLGFLFVGRGSEGAALKARYGDLPNILFGEEIPPEEIAGLYAQCQVGLVALDPRHQSHNIPGKFLSYMQAGLPVLACVNPKNDLVDLICAHGVGAVTEGQEDGPLDRALLQALDLAGAAGVPERCRALAAGMFSSERAVSQIIAAIEVADHSQRNY